MVYEQGIDERTPHFFLIPSIVVRVGREFSPYDD